MDVTVQGVDANGTLESVFRKDYPQLCRLAAMIVGDAARAEELVMDAFARCLGNRRDPGEPHAYLRSAVINRCRTHLRRRGIERRVNAVHHSRADTSALPAEPDDEVATAVRQLPPRQRAVVVLTYFLDLPIAGVAEVLGCSTGTVKSQLSKARTTLARTLEKSHDPR